MAGAQGCGQCNQSWPALGSVNNLSGRTRLLAEKAGQEGGFSVPAGPGKADSQAASGGGDTWELGPRRMGSRGGIQSPITPSDAACSPALFWAVGQGVHAF